MFTISLVLFSFFSFAESHNNMRAVSAVESEKAFLTESYEELVDFQPIENWQIRQAHMKALRTNDPQSIEQIELIEKSSSYDLSYEIEIEGNTLVFQPQKIYVDGCGTKIIEALNIQGNEILNLKLKDASGSRTCKDRVLHQWKAEISSSIGSADLKYTFVGNPQ